MKKFLLVFAAALMMASCGQKDNKEQEQTETKKTIIPPGMPVAPMPQIPPTNQGLTFETSQGATNPNAPVLKLEEGQPLDFSQLQGGGKSMEEQVASQIDSIRFKAEQGDAKFQYAYGVCYEKGWGVDQDEKEALAWYRKAAAQKNGPAFNSIGNFYRTGTVVKADPKQAFGYYQKGAAEKDAQAMLNLGNCYYYGMGVEKNEKTAVKWWKDAAEAGNVYAISQMGDCYYSGYGVDQDQTYAELLMRKASDGGMKEAQDFLDKNFKK